jgi:DNA replication protein DnaC
MLNEETYKQLVEMKLHGIARAFNEYLNLPEKDALTFEERFGLMVDREWTERKERQLKYRLGRSKLREEACVEDIDFRHARNLDRSVIQRLITCRFVKEHENIIFTGKTGLGKTWLACAFAHKACREGYSTLYVRIPRMLQEIFVAHGDGSYPKVMDRLSKPDVLVLDDFGLAPLSDRERRDLLEVLEDRQGRRSTIVTSQLATKHWHEIIGEPTIADAIMDRLISSSHRIEMEGKSLRGKHKEDGADR